MQMQTDLQSQIMTLEEAVTKLQESIQSQSSHEKVSATSGDLSMNNLQRHGITLVKEARKIHKQASVVSAARSTVWEGSDRSSLPSVGLSESQHSTLHGRIENWRTDAVIQEEIDDKVSETKDTNISSKVSIFSSNNASSSMVTYGDLDSDTEDELDWEVLQNLVKKANHFYDLGLFSEAEKGFRDTLRLSQSLGISKKAEFDISAASLKLARSCLQQQKLRESEAILLELLDKSASNKAQRELRLDAYYTLSELYLLTREHAKAKAYCKKSVAGRRKLLGHDDKSVYDAIHMLVFICIIKGEKHEADALSELLPQQLRANQWLSLTALQAKYDSALPPKDSDNSQIPFPRTRSELPTEYEATRARRGARNGGPWGILGDPASNEMQYTHRQAEKLEGRPLSDQVSSKTALVTSSSQEKISIYDKEAEPRLKLTKSMPNFLQDQTTEDYNLTNPSVPQLPSSPLRVHRTSSDASSEPDTGQSSSSSIVFLR